MFFCGWMLLSDAHKHHLYHHIHHAKHAERTGEDYAGHYGQRRHAKLLEVHASIILFDNLCINARGCCMYTHAVCVEDTIPCKVNISDLQMQNDMHKGYSNHIIFGVCVGLMVSIY